MKYMRTLRGDTLVISDESGRELLTIREAAGNGRILFELNGDMKNEIACEFEDELTAAATVCRDIRVDMTGLRFIASAGLSALLSSQKNADRLGGQLVLCGLNGAVKKAFEDSGFTELFIIEEDNGGIE